jgi:hypothetical protein
MNYLGILVDKLIREKFRRVYEIEDVVKVGDDRILIDFIPVESNDMFGVGIYFYWDGVVNAKVDWFQIPYEDSERIEVEVGNWAYETFKRFKNNIVEDNTVTVWASTNLPISMNNIDDILNSVGITQDRNEDYFE